MEEPNPARIEFKPSALVATALALVALVAWIEREAIEEAFADTAGQAEEDRGRRLPSVLDPGSMELARTALGADTAFDLSDATSQVRAFVFDEGGDDYTIVFYRERDGRFEQLGAPVNTIGFDPPMIDGSPPRMRIRERRLQAMFVFRVEETDVVFEPDHDPATARDR